MCRADLFSHAGLSAGNTEPLSPILEASFALEFCEPEPIQEPVLEPVRLLIEHPWMALDWYVARRMEPQFFLLQTTDGKKTLVLHQSEFVTDSALYSQAF
jgi:hypothetical protein